jgi:hypothetical protein
MRVKSLLPKSVAAAATGVFLVAVLPGTAEAGTSATSCHYDPYACAHFIENGDILRACDYRADGRRVVGQLRWRGRQAEVPDRSAGQCTDLNLDISEGVPVDVRVCVQNVGCSRWRPGVA